MKVLQIVTAYPRSPGDLITPWLVETLHRLKERGVETEVLAPSYRGLGDHMVDGIRVHRFRYAPRRWEDLTHDQTAPDRIGDHPAYLALLPGYVLAGARAAARLARTGAYDAIHVHWPIPHALFGMAARAAGDVPLICSFYSVELTWVRRKMPYLRPFLRRVIRTSDAVTAISSSTEAMVRELYDRPVDRIPFGATVEPGGRSGGSGPSEEAPKGLDREPPASPAPPGKAAEQFVEDAEAAEESGLPSEAQGSIGAPAGRLSASGTGDAEASDGAVADAEAAEESGLPSEAQGSIGAPAGRLSASASGATEESDGGVPSRAVKARERPSRGAPPGRPYNILFVGRLVERKGVQHLIQAVARLRGSGRAVELDVVGDGSFRERLEAQALEAGLGGAARFHGFVSREELSRRFAESDVFALPAVVDAKGDVEGLGVVLIEALRYGTPVVASAAGGIVDIVRDGETGLLVPPGDAGALADAIARLQDDPGLAARLVTGGQAHVEREFAWEVVVDRLVDLYGRMRDGWRKEAH